MQRIVLMILLVGFSMLIKAQIGGHDRIGGQNKRTGHYWDKEGKKHEGEVKPIFKTSGTAIKFYQNGKKVGKLNKSKMKSFVWGIDSFALIQNFKASVTALGYYDSDFAQVIMEGDINLYRHWRKVRDPYSDPNYAPVYYIVYVYVVHKTGKFYGMYNRSQFKKYFLPLVADDAKLTNKLIEMHKGKWIDGLPYFVAEYNARLKP